MKNLKYNKLTSGFTGLVLTLLVNISFLTQAQTPFKIVESSFITVTGTSNLHDWVMTAEEFTCDGNFTLKGNVLQDVKSLSFSLPVKNLKSKESLLNTRAYKALKAEQYSRITFKLSDATVLQQQKMIKVTGTLSIAGVSNVVSFQTSYSVVGDEIICKGKKIISMSDYKIKAPSFMMGALKTGNDVTVDIRLKMKK